MTRLKSPVRFIPIVVALGFVVLGVSFDRFRLPGREYYGTAAQIIPVLVVALTVELRDEARSKASTLFKTELFAFLLGGELAALLGASGALRGNAEGTGEMVAAEAADGMVAYTSFLSDLLAAVTGAGLAGGFVAVVLIALLGPQAIAEDRRVGGRRSPAGHERAPRTGKEHAAGRSCEHTATS